MQGRLKDWRSRGISRQGFYKANGAKGRKFPKWPRGPKWARFRASPPGGPLWISAGSTGLTGLSLVWWEAVLPEVRGSHTSHRHPHPSARERLDGEVTTEANLRKRWEASVPWRVTFAYTDINSSFTFYIQFTHVTILSPAHSSKIERYVLTMEISKSLPTILGAAFSASLSWNNDRTFLWVLLDTCPVNSVYWDVPSGSLPSRGVWPFSSCPWIQVVWGTFLHSSVCIQSYLIG